MDKDKVFSFILQIQWIIELASCMIDGGIPSYDYLASKVLEKVKLKTQFEHTLSKLKFGLSFDFFPDMIIYLPLKYSLIKDKLKAILSNGTLTTPFDAKMRLLIQLN